MKQNQLSPAALAILAFAIFSCNNSGKQPSKEAINSMNLVRGVSIQCGPSEQQFGKVEFEIACAGSVKEDFELGVALLHSFEYLEAEKVFARVIDNDPGCPMAYWGVAMSNFHLLWSPPTGDELRKGHKAITLAREIGSDDERQTAYINAAYELFRDYENQDHMTRCRNFEKAMENLHAKFPNDREAATLYALSLDATASPRDTTFSQQIKAGKILTAIYPDEPNHPGLVHYIIHTYDNPVLAEKALQAARHYADVAPSSAHALHMPSHIFTRLGLWEESVNSNLQSVSSARCYAEQAGLNGNWDEEIHGLDYLVYAYLQMGDNYRANQQLKYLQSLKRIDPVNFKVAYAFAAIPSRIVLENRNWKEAANLQVNTSMFNWNDYPWQNAIIHFTRALGSLHLKDLASANTELDTLNRLREKLLDKKDEYNANQVLVQIKTVEAWVLFLEGNSEAAVSRMREAADLEDITQKHPVTPGEVIPARELLGEMLLQMNKPADALREFQINLKKHPNRLNAMKGAQRAGGKT